MENGRRLLKQQADFLADEKHVAEMEIEDFYRSLGIVSECFFTRDHEILSDLSYDDPYKELNKVIFINLKHSNFKLILGKEFIGKQSIRID